MLGHYLLLGSNQIGDKGAFYISKLRNLNSLHLGIFLN